MMRIEHRKAAMAQEDGLARSLRLDLQSAPR